MRRGLRTYGTTLDIETGAASSWWSLNLEMCEPFGNAHKSCVSEVGLPEKIKATQLKMNFK